MSFSVGSGPALPCWMTADCTGGRSPTRIGAVHQRLGPLWACGRVGVESSHWILQVVLTANSAPRVVNCSNRNAEVTFDEFSQDWGLELQVGMRY